ncbi:hypothetical protein ACIBTV_27795 [Micromonospora sp. NPDC049366]|uniref:hypothetical protein n=1 Tax=Micromonospora sp. NPDC049366 TaxID=3364271 RepID=UPI0037BD0E34
MMGSQTAAEAEIDVAALHLARTYTPDDTSPAALRRWAGRIRVWAHRYPDQITDRGRAGRRRRYDLAELQQVADRVFNTADAAVL